MVLITHYERHFVLLVIFYFLTFHPSWILIARTINTLHSCSSCWRRWASQDHCLLSMLPWAPASRGSLRISNQSQALPPCYPGQLEQRHYLHHGSGTLSGLTKHWCLTGAFPALACRQHPASTATVTLKNPKPSKQKIVLVNSAEWNQHTCKSEKTNKQVSH